MEDELHNNRELLYKHIFQFIENSVLSDKEFNEIALKIYRHQVNNNHFYRKLLFNSFKLASNSYPNSWQEIPLITTDLFKLAELRCCSAEEIVKVFYSSGTLPPNPLKGEPRRGKKQVNSQSLEEDPEKEIYHLPEASTVETGSYIGLIQGKPIFAKEVCDKVLEKSFERHKIQELQRSKHLLAEYELKLYEASLWKTFSKAFGVRQNEDLNYFVLTESPEEKPNSSLIHMFETVRKKLAHRKDCYFIKDGRVQIQKLEKQLKKTLDNGKKCLIVGTAFSFVHWLEESGQTFQLPSHSLIMETGGFKGRSKEISKQELYELIAKKLGLPISSIVGQYGMSELGTQFYSLPPNPLEKTKGKQVVFEAGGSGFDIPTWCRVRILNPENLSQEVSIHQEGLIAIYDLCNIDSAAFVLTGDVGVKINEQSFEVIGRAKQLTPKGCSLMLG